MYEINALTFNRNCVKLFIASSIRFFFFMEKNIKLTYIAKKLGAGGVRNES